MKAIFFDDKPGGTKEVYMFNVPSFNISVEHEIIDAKNADLFVLQRYASPKMTLEGQFEKGDVIVMNRKRNILKHFQDLFRRKKRGHTNTL